MTDREDLTKHTLWLRRGDFDELKDTFPSKGASKVVREIVSSFIDRNLRRTKPLSPSELDEIATEANENE